MDVYNRLRRDMEKELSESGMDSEKILAVLDGVTRKYCVENKDETDADNDEILEEFLSCCEYERMSDGTIKNYKLTIGAMLKTINAPISAVRPADLREYIKSYQKERGISDVTANKYREYFRAFFKWCMSEGYCDRNPAADLKPIRCEKKQVDYYTQTELELIRNACADCRDRALVEMLYSTGCRVSELCILKKSDIDWDKGTVHLFGKGRKHRTSYLNAKAAVFLKMYLDSRTDDEEWLFLSYRGSHSLTRAGIERILSKICVRVDERFQKKITPHRFRHTMATTAIQHGMPVEDIQALLGHANINTTLLYAQTCDENVQTNHKRYIM